MPKHACSIILWDLDMFQMIQIVYTLRVNCKCSLFVILSIQNSIQKIVYSIGLIHLAREQI